MKKSLILKSNHVEKTEHPCQFPVELIERLVLSMSNENDLVLDPFVGTGTSIIAALRHDRRGIGADVEEKYIITAKSRIHKAIDGTLKVRPMNKPIYDPVADQNKVAKSPYTDSSCILCGR
ncbi:MAG: DNA methyltransferase [Lentisphaeria bacterium]